VLKKIIFIGDGCGAVALYGLMQKTYLFFPKIGMMQANVLNSIGNMDTVPFLTIGKPKIYLLKSLGKSATVFIRVTNNYQNWLLTYLIYSAIGIRLTNIRPLYIYRITNSRGEYCIRISYRF
jgi:hypothetical protein